MTSQYKVVKFKFDLEHFAHILTAHVSQQDVVVFAAVIGVDESTLRNWRNKIYKEPFAFPSMRNFIAACNALDLDPREFFILEG